MELKPVEYNGNFTFDDDEYHQLLNGTSMASIPELQCYLSYYNQTLPGPGVYCNTTWDGLSCWSAARGATEAFVQCFKFLNGVPYDTTQNATRECQPNGIWANRSDYSRCRPLLQKDESFEVLWDVKEAATIYYVGYGLSLIALAIALTIFLYFKDLRCLRNTIHTNLMVTYLFIDLTWIITASLQSSTSSESNKAACYLVILLTYLMGTNFFWMFVEGLYLYILVVKTFSVETIKIQTYALLGWGVPAAVVMVWAIVKANFAHSASESALHGCPWQNRDLLDYTFVCPVILVLLINIYFLGRIMWVLITKLRAATSVESKQYRKAAKALLVLIPLLGVTYIIVIVTPPHRTARVVFSYAQATLLSTQGFTVAVLYCFLNGEVRKSVRHHWEQWKDQRGLGHRSRKMRSGQSIHDAGFRYSNRGVRDRESCISLSTSGTWLSTNCKSSRPTNGSYSPVAVRDEAV